MGSQATVDLERPDRASSAAAGRLSVGDYVGESAAHAALCVRRAGLRPALERSLGCDPALNGTIVAQEPPPGDEQVRNGIVTLFVAAPGSVLAGDTGTPNAPREDRASTAIEDFAPALAASSTSVSSSDVRRSRKRRHGGCADPSSFDPPPAPVIRVAEPEAETADDGVPPHRTAEWTASGQVVAGPSEDMREQERLAAHLEDVFAGRVSDARYHRRKIYLEFTAETRCSGIDLQNGLRIRKGAFDSIRNIALKAGNSFPAETEARVKAIASNGWYTTGC